MLPLRWPQMVVDDPCNLSRLINWSAPCFWIRLSFLHEKNITKTEHLLPCASYLIRSYDQQTVRQAHLISINRYFLTPRVKQPSRKSDYHTSLLNISYWLDAAADVEQTHYINSSVLWVQMKHLPPQREGESVCQQQSHSVTWRWSFLDVGFDVLHNSRFLKQLVEFLF